MQCWWGSLWCGDAGRFFDGVCLREVTGSIENVMVVEMVVGVVESVKMDD